VLNNTTLEHQGASTIAGSPGPVEGESRTINNNRDASNSRDASKNRYTSNTETPEMLKALASEEKSRADSSLSKHSRDVNSIKKNSSSRTDSSTREN
jgi:hypothetical protein